MWTCAWVYTKLRVMLYLQRGLLLRRAFVFLLREPFLACPFFDLGSFYLGKTHPLTPIGMSAAYPGGRMVRVTLAS